MLAILEPLDHDKNILLANDSNFFHPLLNPKALDACSSKPCKNEGECIDVGFGKFRCKCAKGFTGPTCEEGNKINIIT